MPVFEYRCRDCGAKFEKLVRVGTASCDLKCPTCDSRSVDKVFSVFGTLKGSTGTPSGAGSFGGGCSPVSG